MMYVDQRYLNPRTFFALAGSAYRYPENDTKPGLPKIPAMPIGYDYAEKILA